jgi:hypothetical protein
MVETMAYRLSGPHTGQGSDAATCLGWGRGLAWSRLICTPSLPTLPPPFPT